jgi:hypothetical protein
MDACDYAEPGLFGPEEPICPYTGLRTFTEDEAIYFRGREEHVAKCLTLLAAERFVMITGASGDGKSSLVFAGLLPEVRAGFLRGRYSNWAVATFRPERHPLRNMARALAPALRMESSVEAVETELEHGFSALVQLYQASALCPPTELPAGLTVAEQRQQQRQAANLLVVVDQFEEFFTNPENYAATGPSTAAQTVVNLLLETTQLAQAQNLPIYIVCTMRSDFVGQCAEFGGLIEQIGTSQYFVPRLLRHEFVEVIKEPALLSGNRISERLVQRLLYDIHFGQDQLPVLQHALRRIWLAADQGREEMDLIHYAMVGGLADELPAADQARFAQWRAGLSAVQRQFLLGQPSLRNVLDAHANQLYHEAASLYNNDFQPPLPPGTVESVIERTFRVLTRTDGQRVVRNRLSGAEITAIIGDPALPWPVVCHILRPFRQAGTTFLSPFLLEDANDRDVLPPDAVLDITHESLIRNWKHLSEWASSEAEDVRIAQDLMQQASRWEANAENQGFLLPIGSYSYFSQWNRRKQVNASWLAHYVATDGSAEAPRQAQAGTQHSVLRRFLETSRRRLFMPLLIARYGLGRLAAAVLLPVLLVGLGWWVWQQRTQQADYVAYSIIEERLPFLKSPYVPVSEKAYLLINTDRLKSFAYWPGIGGRDTAEYAFPHMLDALANDTLALDIELAMYQWVNTAQYDAVEREHPWSRRLLLDLDRRLARADSLAGPVNGQPLLRAQRRELAVYAARVIMALTHYLTYAQLQKDKEESYTGPEPRFGFVHVLREPLAGPVQALVRSKQRLLQRLLAYAQQEVATTTGAPPSPVEFGFCLRVLLGQGEFAPAELRFLDGINPLIPGPARQQFLRFFPRARAIYNEGSLGHSGGYLTSAIVFAALRQPTQTAQCLDSLRQYATKLESETDGGLALIPYLVKYRLLTPSNIYPLLHKCSLAGGFSFNELYAATVYSLLSVSPNEASYAVSPDHQATAAHAADASASGAVDPQHLNADRVSFSVPVAVREQVWAALRQAVPTVAKAQALFYKDEADEPAGLTTTKYRRNKLFLEAFLAKSRGTYLAAIAHDSAAASQSFTDFSRALSDLKLVCRPTDLISTLEWNLGTAEAVGITQASSVAQSPVRYLQQPTRPKTTFVGSYFTCAFDAFFLYQLRREAAQPMPDARLVQLLDSVAFVEAAYPDRTAVTRLNSLQVAALNRDIAYVPNLVWMHAIRAVPLPLGAARQRRNAFLYTVSAALQDSARLAQLRPARDMLPFVRQLAQQPGFAQVPLRVLLSNLAAALARAKRGREAFVLAKALPAPLATISAIRVGEQAMLLNDRSQQASLDSFLLAYQHRLRQSPLEAANSVIALYYWQFDKDSRLHSSFQQTVTTLIREGRPSTQEDGPTNMCKGRSLADDSYHATLDVPAYQSERLRQRYFNTILTGLAHLKTAKPGDGWREYDEVQLLSPADYDGPAE